MHIERCKTFFAVLTFRSPVFLSRNYLEELECVYPWYRAKL